MIHPSLQNLPGVGAPPITPATLTRTSQRLAPVLAWIDEHRPLLSRIDISFDSKGIALSFSCTTDNEAALLEALPSTASRGNTYDELGKQSLPIVRFHHMEPWGLPTAIYVSEQS